MMDSGVTAKMVSLKPSSMMYDTLMLVNTPKHETAAKFIDFCLIRTIQDIIAQGQGMGSVHPQASTIPEIAGTLPPQDARVSFDDADEADGCAAAPRL